MPWKFTKIVEDLSKKGNYKMLKETNHGLERECLRIQKDGKLAMTPHPLSLGSPLTNKYISTDFSESQLEFITPPMKKEEDVLRLLEDVHSFAIGKLGDEFLWPSSMPCVLPSNDEIPLARYGSSNLAKKKTLYRKALGRRYSRKMQTISGIHYNFSFNDKFWDYFYKNFGKKKQTRQEFISESYFRLSRNFLALSWMDTYLFGASPAIDKSYLDQRPKYLKKLNKDTYYGLFATSLRMSSYGYCCKVQAMLNISFNSLGNYISDLKKATSTPYKKYTRIGVNKKGEQLQLNDFILQDPAEYYAAVRPKRVTGYHEDILDKLSAEGVEYLEVRTVDVSPFEKVGVSLDHLKFLHLFMVYCLLQENHEYSAIERLNMIQNHDKVAIHGRKPGLKLVKNGKKIKLREWGLETLNNMRVAAELLDMNYKNGPYINTLNNQINKIIDPNQTPSARILAEMLGNKTSFRDFNLAFAKQHSQTLKFHKITKEKKAQFTKSVAESLLRQEAMEVRDEQYTEGYEDMEISTQILIKDAQQRGVEVDVIDRSANFIRLKKGDKVEYVRQATKTSKDSLITYLIMENKIVTKAVLDENGIRVPKGGAFDTPNAALASYPDFKKIKVAIKPATTNYGIGISFAKANDKKSFKEGVKEAFKHDKSIIIEEFIEGKEYRFLVINGAVVGVTHRIPANIKGDGEQSIAQLVKIKNDRPKNYKAPSYFIRTGKTEKDFLAKQGLTFKSVPKRGQTVFLRENSNVSTGGDPIDFTDDVSVAYKKIAIQAAEAVNAKLCGVDMIITDTRAVPTSTNYGIIELNFNPVLNMHNFPYKGENRDVGKAVLDLLGF